MIKKTIFSSCIVLWASLDLPTLAGTLIFAAGLVMALYIWARWGIDGDNKRRQQEYDKNKSYEDIPMD